MPPTHFVSRPNLLLLLLHQHLETELGYFCIYLMVPNQFLPQTKPGRDGWRILLLEVHNGYLYLFFSFHLPRDIYKDSYFDQLWLIRLCALYLVLGLLHVVFALGLKLRAASIWHISGHYGKGNSEPCAEAPNTSVHILLAEVSHMAKPGIHGAVSKSSVRVGQ